jgi:hypothetical protein
MTALLAVSMGAGPMMMGCDKTLHENEKTTVAPNGEKTTSQEKTVEHPNGTVTTEKEATHSNPNAPTP